MWILMQVCDRLAKSHDFVMSLTISQPIPRSHELATDISHFLKSQTQNKFWEL